MCIRDRITDDPAFLADPTIQKYQHAMEVISDALSHGTYVGMEYGLSLIHI